MNISQRFVGISLAVAILFMVGSVYMTPAIAAAQTNPPTGVEAQIAKLLELIKVLQSQIAFLLSKGEAGDDGGSQDGLKVGDTVEATDKLKVRSSAGTSGTVLTTVPALTRGTIVGGPQTANELTWWRVAYQTVTGWSAANWLRLVTTLPPSPTTPTVSLSANPNTVMPGQSATLSWTSTNTTSCTGSGFNASGVSGSTTVTPTSNTTYSITCTGAGGSASASASVTVSNSNTPTATLSASPSSVTPGQSSMLTWSSTNTTSCTGSGFNASGVSGSTTVTPTANTTYSITCTGTGGSASASASITVSTTPPPSGTAFFDDFSGSLDSAKYTASHGRMDNMTPTSPSSAAISGGRLHIKAGMQNYGDSAVRINQPFDFANRTGTISFDVNTNDSLGGWTQIMLSELPYPYISFEYFNTHGPLPQDGLILQFRGNMGCAHLIEYRDGAQVQQIEKCDDYSVKTGPSTFNKFVVNVSTSQVTVTTDGDHVLRFDTSLGFTRGYLYLGSHNHASQKYENLPTWDTQWDNVRFDGPIFPLTRVALSPFNLPANPSNPRLVMQAQHDLQNTNVTLAYRLNGNAARNIPLVRYSGQVGVYLLSVPVNVNELRTGVNAITFEHTGMTTPLFSNVQLVWDGAAGNTLPTPSVSLSASPSSITPGQTSTLTWSSTNTTSCTGNGFNASGTSGSASVSPASNTTYSITCTGAGGSASASASVTVTSISTPTVALSANPTSITPGQSSTLTWASTNTTSCTGTGFSASGVSGSTSVSPSSNTTYSITCSGAGGSASASVNVTVSSTPPSTPGLAFSEDFTTAAGFYDRFDRGWSGGWDNFFHYGADINDWPADHDMSCGNPNTTHRIIHHTSIASLKDVAFYHCLPGNDPTRGHVMSTVNTHGYVVAWFTPKQVFRDVTKVCWDQNVTNLGEGKWTSVYFLTPSEYLGQTDLGFSTPDFPTVPRGPLKTGVRSFRGSMLFYENGVNRDGVYGAEILTDKSPRLQHCATDNNNGTVTVSIAQQSGAAINRTVPGSFPDGDVRVVFGDDSYDPDKHMSWPPPATNSTHAYTWHWDNVQVFTR